MKIRSIRWLASIGVGLALGLVAAQTDLSALSRADEASTPTAAPSVADSAAGCANNAGPSTCCYPGLKKENLLALASTVALTEPPRAPARKAAKKPNILVIWGDDIGIHNISAYSHGVMGYKTPTSTGSPRKARSSPISTASRAAQRVERPSSSARTRSGPAC